MLKRIYFLSALILSISRMLMANTETCPKFDWDQLIITHAADENWLKGRQVINFYPCDKDYRDSQAAMDFVAKHFQDAKPINTDAGILKYASDQVSLDGAYIEMGVCTGRTINFIAALNSEKIIYGFDSFEGLPEDWVRTDVYIPKGTFASKQADFVPPVLHNVRLIKGMFADTLPKFKEAILKDTPIAFLHMDCDIYSSTKEVFELLGDHIVSGTIIAFDEFYNYPGSENHEFKALQEFLEKTGKKARFIAFNQYFEQAAVRIE